MQRLLAVKDLNITYRGADASRHHAVQNASFDIEAGEVLGLMGESGCGKTSVALALLGLLSKDQAQVSGSIQFHGKRTADAGPARAVRRPRRGNLDGVPGSGNRSEPGDARKRSGGGSDSRTQRVELETVPHGCGIGARSCGSARHAADFFCLSSSVKRRAAATRGTCAGAGVRARIADCG